jgi:hypothetical protein
MRRHPKEKNAIVFAECPKLWCGMASMVVKNKEPFAPYCLLSCMLLKMLDPLEANLICSPAIRADCESPC